MSKLKLNHNIFFSKSPKTTLRVVDNKIFWFNFSLDKVKWFLAPKIFCSVFSLKKNKVGEKRHENEFLNFCWETQEIDLEKNFCSQVETDCRFWNSVRYLGFHITTSFDCSTRARCRWTRHRLDYQNLEKLHKMFFYKTSFLNSTLKKCINDRKTHIRIRFRVQDFLFSFFA